MSKQRVKVAMISIVLVAISLKLLGQSEASISGILYSPDQIPIPGAIITLTPGPERSITDVDGSFTFESIKPGHYTLEATSLGHSPLSHTFSLGSGNLNLELTMEESTITLSEVSVVGESMKTMRENKGFAMKSVELREEENTSVQVTDLLDRTSGVRIRQNGGMGSRIQFNINGLSGNAIRIFIDGVPIQSYGPSFSLSSIPANMIERIEVYKGVVPVELAGDALGGAINVVLKKNRNQNMLNASYAYGSFNTHQAAVSGNYHNPQSGFTVRGSGFYNATDNNYDVWGNQVYTTEPATGDITYLKARRFHDTYISSGLKADAGISNRKWADELMIGIVYSNLDRDIQHGATMESVYGARKAYQNTRLVNLSYKDRNFLTDKLSLELFSSYSALERHIVDTTAHIYDWDGKRKERYNSSGDFIGWYEYISGAEAGNPTLETSDEYVFVNRAVSSYRLNDQHRITGNFLYTRFMRDSQDPLKHVDIRNLEDTRFANKSIGGLGYEFNGFDNRLKFSAFYKFLHQAVEVVEYKKSGANAEVELNRVDRDVQADGFGFTLAYELLPRVLLLTSAERSFRMPASRELFGNLAENLEPNYNLKPEKSKNLNLGVTLGTYSFGRHETRLQINTFIRDTQDKIKRNVREDDTDETTEFINDDSYISKGFDIDVFYSYNRKLDISGSVSVFNSLFNTEFDENGLQYDWYRDRERNAPFFTSNGNIKYRLKNFLQKDARTVFSANVAYVHWFYRDWESLGGKGKDIIPTQLVCDLGILYTFPNEKIILALDARNILDRQVFDNYALQKPGRAFYAKINYRIL